MDMKPRSLPRPRVPRPRLDGALDPVARLARAPLAADPAAAVALVRAPLDAATSWWEERAARRHAITREQLELGARRELGDRRGEAVKLNALGKAYRHKGQYPEAIVCYKEALEIFRELGNRRGEGLSLSNLGLVYADRGQRLKAISCFEEAVEIFRQLGDRHVEGQILANLGTAYRRQGQDERALALWESAAELVNPGTVAHRRMSDLLGAR